jgi:hypothetical protein
MLHHVVDIYSDQSTSIDALPTPLEPRKNMINVSGGLIEG